MYRTFKQTYYYVFIWNKNFFQLLVKTQKFMPNCEHKKKIPLNLRRKTLTLRKFERVGGLMNLISNSLMMGTYLDWITNTKMRIITTSLSKLGDSTNYQTHRWSYNSQYFVLEGWKSSTLEWRLMVA